MKYSKNSSEVPTNLPRPSLVQAAPKAGLVDSATKISSSVSKSFITNLVGKSVSGISKVTSTSD